MKRSLLVLICGVMALGVASAGCGDDAVQPDEGGGAIADDTSFSLVGTWRGDAIYEAVRFDVELVFSNNGGENGMKPTGTLELKGTNGAVLPFSDGFVDMRSGVSRIASLKGADADGYPWELRGEFTAKRLSAGQFLSDNPTFGIPKTLFLETNLTKD